MPKVPYSYEVNGKLVTWYGSLIPICSLSNPSLLPSLTVYSFRMTQNQNYIGLLCSFHYISYMIMHIILSEKYNGIGLKKTKQIWHCLGRPHISQIQNFGTKIRQNCLCAFEKAISDLFQYIKIWFPLEISSSDFQFRYSLVLSMDYILWNKREEKCMKLIYLHISQVISK